MSGGHWNYKQYHIEDLAGDDGMYKEIKALLMAAAQSERILDWAICGDTDEQTGKDRLWGLWEEVLDKLYGNVDQPKNYTEEKSVAGVVVVQDKSLRVQGVQVGSVHHREILVWAGKYNTGSNYIKCDLKDQNEKLVVVDQTGKSKFMETVAENGDYITISVFGIKVVRNGMWHL